MNTRWAWVLALPYVVTVSTYQVLSLSDGRTLEKTEKSIGTMPCEGTYEECEDLAQALNDAHERRKHPDYWDGKPAGTIYKGDLDKMTPPIPERGEKPE